MRRVRDGNPAEKFNPNSKTYWMGTSWNKWKLYMNEEHGVSCGFHMRESVETHGSYGTENTWKYWRVYEWVWELGFLYSPLVLHRRSNLVCSSFVMLTSRKTKVSQMNMTPSITSFTLWLWPTSHTLVLISLASNN